MLIPILATSLQHTLMTTSINYDSDIPTVSASDFNPASASSSSIAEQSISTILAPIPTTSTQQGTMPLPPEAIYPSREALFEAIQAWAYSYGDSFTTGRSKRMEGSGRWRVLYYCDRYRHHTTT